MSGNIDQRILSIQFDNTTFEKNIQATLKSLDSLTKGLNISTAVNGLKNSLSSIGASTELAGIASGVEEVSNRFSTLGIIGMTVLQNLTTAAMNLGTKIVSNLLDPLVAGGARRALNIEQAKFQFEGLGMDVEKAMNSAREAVSGTAYGLDAAAKAASQFGASGLQAGDEMTSALRAIAGVAAMTSSEYDDIARIFTTVAGNGRVMANELNQIASRGINAAAALGKALGKSEAEVRKMVSSGQISFEMFYTAMDEAFGEHAKSANKTFTGAMSNVRAALSRIGADVAAPYFDNMRDIFNSLIPVIDGIHAALKPTIQVINDLMNAGKNLIVNFLDNLDLTGFESLIVRLTEVFKMDDEIFQKLQRTWAGVVAIFDIAKMAISALLTPVKNIISYFVPAAGSVLDFSASLGDMLVGLRDAIKETGFFEVAMENLGKIVEPIAKVISYAFTGLMKALAGISKIDLTPISDFFAKLSVRLNPFKSFGDASSSLGSIMTRLIDIFLSLGSAVGQAIDFIIGKVGELMAALNFDNVLDLINSLLLTGGLMGFKSFFDSLENSVRTAGGIFVRVDAVLKPLRITLESYQQNLKAGTLLKIAAAIGILAVSLLLMSSIDSAKLAGALVGMGVLMAELSAVMYSITLMTVPKGLFAMGKVAIAMIGVAIAVNVLATALRKIAELDREKIANGLIGIGGLAAILVVAAKSMSTVSGPIVRASAGLILFATALNTMVIAVEKLSKIDTNNLIKGLIGVGAIVAEMAIFLNVTNFGGFNVGKGVGLIAIAASLVILAEAADKFSQIKASSLAKALGAMSILLGALGVFTTFAGGNKVIATGAALNMIAASMLIFGESISRLSTIKWEGLAKGLGSIAVTLGAVTLALNLMNPGVLAKATGLVVVASSLLIIAEAMRKMSGLSWGQVAKGLVSLGGALIIMGVAMKLMQGSIGGAAAILVMAGAISVLTPALIALGGMSLQQIGIGLMAIAGSFAVLGIAAAILAPLVPAILGLSGAILLLGVATLAAGTGVALLAVGIASLAVSGAAGIAALVTVVAEIANMIPVIIRKVGEGLMALLQVIIDNAPVIVEAISVLIASMIEAIVTNIPAIAEAGLTLILELLKAIESKAPDIIKTGFKILMDFLEGIRDNIQELVEVGIDIVLNFLKGVESRIGDIIQGGVDLAISFINGVADAIGNENNRKNLISAIENLITSIISAALGIVFDIAEGAVNIGKNIVLGIRDGIAKFASNAIDAGKQLIRDIFTGTKKEGLIKSPSVLFENGIGRYIPQGIAEGIKKDTSAEEAARKKVQNIVAAFKDEFDKVDLRTVTANLEHQLWVALNPNASYGETSQRELSLIQTKIAQQSQRTKLAMDEYQYMLDTFGKDNEDTRAAYNKMLQEQIDLASLSNELTETIKTNEENRKLLVDNQRKAYKAYFEWYSKNAKALQDLGLTEQQIQEEAQRATGYYPEGMAKNMEANASEAVSTAMTAVETTYEKQSEATFGGLLNSFENWGGNYATGLGDAFLVEFKIVITKIENALNGMADRIELRLEQIITRLESIASTMSADISPTITPVVDMSNVNTSAGLISKTLSGAVTLGVGSAIKMASQAVAPATKPKDSSGSPTGTTVSFTQINNSPKALDRTTIYRNTNTQISKLKDMVNA